MSEKFLLLQCNLIKKIYTSIAHNCKDLEVMVLDICITVI